MYQEAERAECWCTAQIILYLVQIPRPWNGTTYPTTYVGLSILVNLV